MVGDQHRARHQRHQRQRRAGARRHQDPGAQRQSTKTPLPRPARWARWSRRWWTSPRPPARWTTSPTWTPARCWASRSPRPTRPTAPGSTRTNGGTTWNALGAVAGNSARLLAADANTRLYFQPNANYNGTLASAITFRAWDQTSGSNGDAGRYHDATAARRPSPRPPTPPASRSTRSTTRRCWTTPGPRCSAPINEDAGAPSGAVGTLVSALVDFASPAGQVDNVTDVDTRRAAGHRASRPPTPPTAPGTTHQRRHHLERAGRGGRQQRAAAGRGRQHAAATSSPTPTTTARWPARSPSGPGTRPAAAAAALVDTTTNGGTTAFSTATDTASLTVNAVNDAPVLDNTKSPVLTASERRLPARRPARWARWSRAWWTSPRPRARWTTSPTWTAGALLGIAVTAADTTNGTWFYSTNGGTTWNALGAVTEHQRAAAGGRCQHAALLPAQRQLQRHAGQRDHLPGLGPDQRQQRQRWPTPPPTAAPPPSPPPPTPPASPSTRCQRRAVARRCRGGARGCDPCGLWRRARQRHRCGTLATQTVTLVNGAAGNVASRWPAPTARSRSTPTAATPIR